MRAYRVTVELIEGSTSQPSTEAQRTLVSMCEFELEQVTTEGGKQ